MRRFASTGAVQAARAAAALLVCACALEPLLGGHPTLAPVTGLRFDASDHGAAPDPQTFTVAAQGGESLASPAITIDYGSGPTGWIGAPVPSPSGSGYEVSVEVDPHGQLAIGSYQARLLVRCAGAANTLSVDVAMQVHGPTILPDVRSVTLFEHARKDPASSFNVIGAYKGSLGTPTWQVLYTLDEPPWLTVTVTPAPYRFDLTASTSGLAQGVHPAKLRISAPGAADVDIPVTLYSGEWALTSMPKELQIAPAVVGVDGTALAVGGTTDAVNAYYSPLEDAWRIGFTNGLVHRRMWHLATLLATALPDGSEAVAITGGFGPSASDDLVSDSWELCGGIGQGSLCGGADLSAVQALGQRRARHAAVALADGDLLLIGGELWDTSWQPHPTNTVRVVHSGVAARDTDRPMWRTRYDAAAVLLADGRVLVAGGHGASTTVQRTAEIFDPVTETWVLPYDPDDPGNPDAAPDGVAPMLQARARFALVRIGDQVLAVGGVDAAGNRLASAEVYDPATNTWAAQAPMKVARVTAGTAIAVPSGTRAKVLVVGGAGPELRDDGSEPVDDAITPGAEIYDPLSGQWSSAGHLWNARYDRSYGVALLTFTDNPANPAATRNWVLVAGGQAQDGSKGALPAEVWCEAPPCK